MLGRFWGWLRGQEGWSTLILVNLLVLLPVIAFQDAGWLGKGAKGTEDLVKTALGGAWGALFLARSGLTGFVALPLGLILGSIWVGAAIGDALPSIEAVWLRLGPYVAWLRLIREGKPAGPDPLSPLFWESVNRLGHLAARLRAWVEAAMSGGTSSDNLVFLLFIAVLVWLSAFLAGWGLYRWHRPLIATLPAGIFVIVNVFLANQGWGYVVVYLACALLLVLTMNLLHLERAWQRRGIDYSVELPFDIGFAASWLALGLIVLTLPLPGLTANPIANAWWNTVNQPWSEVESTVNRLFSGLYNPNPSLGSGLRGNLVLGGSFSPIEEAPIFMYVTTDEPVPDIRDFREIGEEPTAPVHYWRGITYDYYTGRGWQQSERGELDRTARQPVMLVDPLGFVPLTQEVEIVSARAGLIYAANQPITVSLPYRLLSMGPEDYAGLLARGPGGGNLRYTVVSWIPHLGEEDLREASTIYPSWVIKRYLQLPPSLPQRVIDLSREITRKATNPYDKALAIQEYLRKLPYDPNILLPPGDFDAVDYFLFIQKGYCNYFGTAMAVMLRAVGVPARVAQGYLPGEYDWNAHRYIIRTNHQHVWTEVYFPPFGWIEFEPTPGYPAITRPPGSLLGRQPEEPPPLPPTATSRDTGDILGEFGAFGPLLAALLVIGGLGLLAWRLYPAWERRLSPARYVAMIYRRMARCATWGGFKRSPAQTPAEHAAALAARLAQGRSRVGHWRPGEPDISPQERQHILNIAMAYQAACYGPRPLTEDDREWVRSAWLAVRHRLWALAVKGCLRWISSGLRRRRNI